jgi:hypothetical protein
MHILPGIDQISSSAFYLGTAHIETYPKEGFVYVPMVTQLVSGLYYAWLSGKLWALPLNTMYRSELGHAVIYPASFQEYPYFLGYEPLELLADFLPYPYITVDE